MIRISNCASMHIQIVFPIVCQTSFHLYNRNGHIFATSLQVRISRQPGRNADVLIRYNPSVFAGLPFKIWKQVSMLQIIA